MKKETREVFISEDGFEFDSADSCKKHEKKLKEEKIAQKEWLKKEDYIRLNAESITHLKELLIQFAQEYWKTKLEFTEFFFENRERNINSNDKNIFQILMEGSTGNKNLTLFDILGNGFGYHGKKKLVHINGLYSSDGSFGSSFRMRYQINLCDFPKMEKNYRLLKELLIKKENIDKTNEQLASQSAIEFDTTEVGSSLISQIEALNEEEKQIINKRDNLSKNYDKCLSKYVKDKTNYLEFKETEQLNNLVGGQF